MNIVVLTHSSIILLLRQNQISEYDHYVMDVESDVICGGFTTNGYLESCNIQSITHSADTSLYSLPSVTSISIYLPLCGVGMSVYFGGWTASNAC